MYKNMHVKIWYRNYNHRKVIVNETCLSATDISRLLSIYICTYKYTYIYKLNERNEEFKFRIMFERLFNSV